MRQVNNDNEGQFRLMLLHSNIDCCFISQDEAISVPLAAEFKQKRGCFNGFFLNKNVL